MRCMTCMQYEYQWVLTGKGAKKVVVDPSRESKKRKPVNDFVCSRCVQKGVQRGASRLR